MSPEYEAHVMGLPAGVIDAEIAKELFEGNTFERTGSLERGFEYWVRGESVEHLCRIDVYPVGKRPKRRKAA